MNVGFAVIVPSLSLVAPQEVAVTLPWRDVDPAHCRRFTLCAAVRLERLVRACRAAESAIVDLGNLGGDVRDEVVVERLVVRTRRP